MYIKYNYKTAHSYKISYSYISMYTKYNYMYKSIIIIRVQFLY